MNRVAFSIFGLDIMWYGVLMAIRHDTLCIISAKRSEKSKYRVKMIY